MRKTFSLRLARAPKSKNPLGWVGTIIVYAMFGITALMGLGALSAGVRLLLTGEEHWGKALFVTVFGAVIAAIGLAYYYIQVFKAPIWRARERAIQARYPGQPWMLRSDWAARKVTDSSMGVMIFSWIWTVGWWGILLIIWSVNKEKILAAVSKSWWEAALLVLFPLGGLIGLTIAWQATRSWLRYGRSTLRIDTLPGYLGDSFRGGLSANFRVRPKTLDVDLVCEHLTWRKRYRQGKTTHERVVEKLWSRTFPLEPSRIMLSGRGADTLAIDLPLPADQPESEMGEDASGIVWRIHVHEPNDPQAKHPPYSASFEIPVYARR